MENITPELMERLCNEIREEMDRQIKFCGLTPRTRQYAIYRFGLQGEQAHSKEETAEKFSVPVERIRSLDRKVLRLLKIDVSPRTIRFMLRLMNEPTED